MDVKTCFTGRGFGEVRKGWHVGLGIGDAGIWVVRGMLRFIDVEGGG